MPSPRRATVDLRFQTANLKSTARPRSAFPRPRVAAPARNAFTLLELLVVIGIIVLLAAILVPVVSQVRMKGYVTTTEAQMQRIAAAIQSYYHDFKAYPGPIPNSQLVGGATPPNIIPDPNSKNPSTITVAKITSSENLILGLFGVLNPPDPSTTSAKYTGFPPTHDVLSLNPVRPAAYHYIDYIPEELSVPSGFAYASRFGGMNPSGQSLNIDALAENHPGDTSSAYAQPIGGDSEVPEFLDRIPDYLPILYIRANVGVPCQIDSSGTVTGIVTVSPKTNPAQYDATQLKPYGFNNVSYGSTGNGDYSLPASVKPSDPGDAPWVAYFMNPNVAGQPRGKDGFVLISAGADRLYGTKDDIIVTP
jgi:prepilin-type N-terminal cleavage/methylation domain-containing protein